MNGNSERLSEIKLHSAYKFIIALLLILTLFVMLSAYLWISQGNDRPIVIGNNVNPISTERSAKHQLSPKSNLVQNAYPYVDFKKIYPSYNSKEIDGVQRETYSVRYVYEPFVQFRPLPTKGKFLEITEAGFRKSGPNQVWPPDKNNFVVFVFGGSTTFGYGLANEHTVVAALEEEMGRSLNGRKVTAYNFGRGYYYSTQEKNLFEQLLIKGLRPDYTIFIDGLNDFYYFHGIPELTSRLHSILAPDIPTIAPDLPLGFVRDKSISASQATEIVIKRYENNVRMITAVANSYGAPVLFVGQPIPFHEFPKNAKTYPFRKPFGGHKLIQIGYQMFKRQGLSGRFGKRFIWAGDAFSKANTIMYADSIHYTETGSRILAKFIIKRALKNNMWPPALHQ